MTWSAFIAHPSQRCGSDQRPPGVPSHLYNSVLALWIHLSSRLPALEVTFLLAGKEIHLLHWSAGTVGVLSGVSILCTWVNYTCIQAQTYMWTQGSDQRLHSNLEARQGPNVHHLYRLWWKIKQNTCVLLGSEHPGRRGTILNCLWEFTTRSNGVKSGKEKQFEHQ